LSTNHRQNVTQEKQNTYSLQYISDVPESFLSSQSHMSFKSESKESSKIFSSREL